MNLSIKKYLRAAALVSIFGIFCAESFAAGTKFLIAGCNWNKIAVVDKDTQKISFLYEIPQYSECNSAVLTKDKKLFYTNKRNARIVNPKTSEILWEENANNGEEYHTADVLKNGRLLLGVCGRPARIVEMSSSGKVLSEVKFETGVESVHMQFRKIAKNRKGNYYVGLFGGRALLEVSPKGEILKNIKLDVGVFAVKELASGGVLISGDGGKIRIINPETGEVLRRIDSKSIEGAELLFATEARMLKNGNLLITNWNGHSKDKSQPKILEITPENKIVWKLNNNGQIDNVSSICVLK